MTLRITSPRTTTLRTRTQTLVIGAVLGIGAATSARAADPTGDWRVADGVANIRVAECNGSMWGAVAWEKIPGGRDKYNPDPAKQGRPTLAMPILLDMKKQSGEESWKGTVYNAKDGKSYDSSITPTGTDQLRIQGCVLGFLCGGETWTRVGPPIPSSPANIARLGKPAPANGSNPVANTTGKLAPGSPANAQARMPTPRAPGDIGDICLLPGIARFAH